MKGSYDKDYDLIKVNVKDSSNIDLKAIKNTLIHEIQHAIQKQEGFAIGSSPSTEKMKLMYERGRKGRLDQKQIKDEA